MGGKVTMPPAKFGARVDRNVDTVYQAADDGSVEAKTADCNKTLFGYADNNNPPVTVRQQDFGGGAGDQTTSVTMHVLKDEYWKITVGGGGAATICWIPLEP